MAGTVLESYLDNALADRHALAAHLSDQYRNFSMQRDPKVVEWMELRNYIFATSTRDTTNKTLPWKNSTTTPKLTQLRDNLHANYMAALFSSGNRWFKWEGADRSSVTTSKTQAIEAYMENKMRVGGFEKIVSKLLYDYIDYGNAIADVEYIIDSHVDNVTAETIVTYVGPKLVRVSPLDHIFNPLAAEYTNTPKFTRVEDPR